jgi:hypothetical protein
MLKTQSPSQPCRGWRKSEHNRATQCLVRQFVDPVLGEIRYSLPTAGGTTTLFVSELKTPYHLAILELVQIVTIDHLWKMCLISLTEIDELTN